MILDQVEIGGLFSSIHEMEQWCELNLGPQAPETDCVDVDRPWIRKWNYGNTVWYFATEEAATLFRLRWL